MRLNRRVAAAVLATSAFVISGQVALASSSQAISAASGDCSDGASTGYYDAWYTVEGSNTFTNYFEVILTNDNRIGNKNNVYIEQRKNRTGLPDQVLKTWRSGDNVPGSQVYRTSGAAGSTIPRGKAHAKFELVFDNSGADDSCHGDTDDY